MDILKISLIAQVVAAAIIVGTVIALASANSASRNLVMAAGTLGAAIVFYFIQLAFELRSSVVRDQITVEFTIDRAVPLIRQWIYEGKSPWRIGVETNASSWLASNNPAVFNQEQEREKITSDLALFSLLAFFGHEEFDWQLSKKVSKGKSGTEMLSAAVSKDNECAFFTASDLKSQLLKTGNSFANAHLSIVSGRLCLPPKSTLQLSARSLLIRNPICQVLFEIDPSAGLTNVKPRSGGETPQLPGGEAQFETRLFGLKVETTYFALRANHRNSSKYRDWCSRIVKGAQEWFEN